MAKGFVTRGSGVEICHVGIGRIKTVASIFMITHGVMVVPQSETKNKGIKTKLTNHLIYNHTANILYFLCLHMQQKLFNEIH